MYYKYNVTKAQRQQWWNNLTSEEQQDYIQRKQHEKMEKRHGFVNSSDQAHLDSIKQEARE